MKKFFNEAEIQKEIPGIVLLSHGALALGMLDTARVVLGNAYNIAAFALEAADDPEVYRETFMRAVEAFPAGAIILVDMFGGSPCNQLFLASSQIKTPYCAFSGMSLPLVVEAATMRELYTGNELKEAIQATVSSAIVDLDAAIVELTAD